MKPLLISFAIIGALGLGAAAQQSNVTNAVVIAALQAMGLFGSGYADGATPVWDVTTSQFIPSSGAGGGGVFSSLTTDTLCFSVANPDACLNRPAANIVQLVSGDSLRFEGAATLYGTTPGIIGFQATSGSSAVFQLGGTSSSFPAIRRNGAALEVVLADQSGGANLTAANLISSADVQAAATGVFYWLGSTQVIAPSNGQVRFRTSDTTSGVLSEQFTNNPTCGTNCGTSPTLNGVDSSFTLIMGAAGVPASGFVVTFNATWPAAPQCTVSMGLAGMVVGKLPLTVVTTTTTATVVTNGTAPANNDVYHFRCSSGQ